MALAKHALFAYLNPPGTVPEGPSTPIFKASGFKGHTPDGFWDQRPKILGTCTR